MSTQSPPPRSARLRWWPVLKWVLFLIVVAAVGQQGWKLWHGVDAGQIRISPGWLIAAVPVSVLGWLPAIGFWQGALASLGDRVRRRDVARAYFGGHLGKYVPGKAVALVVRAGMLKGRGAGPGSAVATSVYETLVTMAAGVCAAVMLLPWIVTAEQAGRWGIPLPKSDDGRAGLVLAVLGASLLALHGFSGIFLRFAGRLVAARARDGQRPFEAPLPAVKPTFERSVTGFVWLLAGWWIHGLSLGLTIHAVTGGPIDWSQWPLWTSAAAFGTVGGFVAVFAPAGLVVREGLLFEVLAPHIGGPQAILVAVLYRGVCLAGEILTAGGLYYGDAIDHHPRAE